MNKSPPLKRLLLAPPAIRSVLLPTAFPRTYLPGPTARANSSTSQHIAQTSFWTSLIPKPLRNLSLNPFSKSRVPKPPKSKEWNPATFYIIIFMLIGSMSIQMIALKNKHEAFERRANAKIGLLREVIERIRNGETVDVEGLLGTGDESREREWEEVLQEIEREDQAWEDAQKRKSIRQSNQSSSESENSKPNLQQTKIVDEKAELEKPRSNAPKGFY